MCGIFGWVGNRIDISVANALLNFIHHRGPDSTGQWFDQELGVWFGHKRLSILDLSPAGHQPMQSNCLNYVIIFNGEIYNFSILRSELVKCGYEFKGASDTEVVLAACVVWGLEHTLKKLEGMFAFALFDIRKKSVYIARDGLGIKPLYYAHEGKNFAFCSELTALTHLPWVGREICQDAKYSYFRYGCVPTPISIYDSVKKLNSGSYLKFKDGKISEHNFWNLNEIAQNAVFEPTYFSDFEEASLNLEEMLLDTISKHMQSDVPYGAFLSGGVDSATVVALMQKISSAPIKTFSVGFLNSANDESIHARAISKYLGTEHSELMLGARDVINCIPKVIKQFDEPFADNSSIPTYLISRFASEKVKVCLSGDGGDELFGGYPRYFWAEKIEHIKKKLGPIGAQILGRGLSAISPKFWDSVIDGLTRQKYSSSDGLSVRVNRFASYLIVSRENVYRDTMSFWSDPSVILNYTPRNIYGADLEQHKAMNWANEMMLIDQKNYLKDDILTKVDRASMAVSLEARVPFLDREIVTYSWSIPDRYKFDASRDRGKIILRDVLYRYVPRDLIERPKQGFGMPLNEWLRGPLRNWAESLLDEKDLENCGLNGKIIRRVWQDHLKGADRQKQIWSVLVYREWLNNASLV